MPTDTEVPSSATTTSQDAEQETRTTNGPANAERHALKRTYLTLLPHAQLVELCLAFEAYSPPHVKSSLWPANLAVAVAELQSKPSPTPQETGNGTIVTLLSTSAKDAPSTSSQHPPETAGASPPMGSLVSDGVEKAAAPSGNPSGQQVTAGSTPSASQHTQGTGSAPQPNQPPVPSTTSASPPVAQATSGPYPHAPYGYPPTQQPPAYPHTPYYQPLSYPHHFPPHPSTPYAHPGYPPSHPPYPPVAQTPGSPFTNTPLIRHPHPVGMPPPDPNGIPADDLPSYEDMLVEALTELGEPEGSAPKSLFTWMASRYPLHTNFRPSASQALQKAFKRGRLEKGSNGKYRLNASWDGGSTSRRTTRRPQTIAQTALPASHGAPATSPFTHAPLSHPARNGTPSGPSASTPNAAQGKPPQYPHYPYHYPPGVPYHGYGLPAPPAASKDASSEARPPTAVPEAATEPTPAEPDGANADDVGEGSDAWEAAQTILKAINFGSLLQAANAKPAEPAIDPSPPAAAPAAPVVASGGPPSAPATLPNNGARASVLAVNTPQALSDRDRASLQAQLALLAAQLAEIAEDTLAGDLDESGVNIDVEGEHGAVEDDEDDDDDDNLDMEPVPIPLVQQS
ncbi:hypothetical protein BC834DRAFT_967529 [Gloeopeniophorella convolvens]|nr:hypothetical protein BC834DRAFT_967529 [Gloeopeniophorella convolvens]